MIRFIQDDSSKYQDRTRKNVQQSYATVCFAVDYSTAGEKLTAKCCKELGKPILQIVINPNTKNIKRGQNKAITDFNAELLKYKGIELNIAGNGIYTLHRYNITQEQIDNIVLRYIQYIKKAGVFLSTIRSGGQTGADEAGLKAADKCGITAYCLAPQGWKMRTAMGKDVTDERDFKRRFGTQYIKLMQYKPSKPLPIVSINQPECKGCYLKLEDTYDDVMSDYSNNGRIFYTAEPIAYMRKIQHELALKQQQKGAGMYNTIIKVNPKDNRVFQSAEFTYGKRKLKYTQVNAIARVKTKETTTKYTTEIYITGTRRYTIDINTVDSYIIEKDKEWKKADYKGKYLKITTPQGTIISGEYNKVNNDVEYDFKFKSKIVEDKLLITIIQNKHTKKDTTSLKNPTDWKTTMHKEMLENDFRGYIESRISSQNKTIIKGKYTKTKYVTNGSDYTEVIYYNSNDIPDITMPIKGIDESYSPSINGNFHQSAHISPSARTVRTIEQDKDEYLPENKPKHYSANTKVQREVKKYKSDKKLMDKAQELHYKAAKIKEQFQKKENYQDKKRLWDLAEKADKTANQIDEYFRH